MATLTSIAVTNRAPKGCTLTFNAASVDLNGAQIKQLAEVVSKLLVECAGEMSSDSGATVVGI